MAIATPIIIEGLAAVVRFAFAPCGYLLPEGKVVIALDGWLVAILRVTIGPNAAARE